MSERTVFNPSVCLSPDTRNQIKAILGDGCFDEFTSNIENRLRDRGENSLADTMLEEVRYGMQTRAFENTRTRK